MAVLGLRFCARAFSSCGERGPLFIAVRGPLTVAASPAAEHRLQTRRLSNCGSRAQPLRGTWDLPRPGPEPVSPELAGGLSTTVPPGKPDFSFLLGICFIGIKLHYNVVLVSAVQWSESTIYIYLYPLPLGPPSSLPPPSRSSQSTELSSLCYTAGSH